MDPVGLSTLLDSPNTFPIIGKCPKTMRVKTVKQYVYGYNPGFQVYGCGLQRTQETLVDSVERWRCQGPHLGFCCWETSLDHKLNIWHRQNQKSTETALQVMLHNPSSLGLDKHVLCSGPSLEVEAGAFQQNCCFQTPWNISHWWPSSSSSSSSSSPSSHTDVILGAP